LKKTKKKRSVLQQVADSFSCCGSLASAQESIDEPLSLKKLEEENALITEEHPKPSNATANLKGLNLQMQRIEPEEDKEGNLT